PGVPPGPKDRAVALHFSFGGAPAAALFRTGRDARTTSMTGIAYPICDNNWSLSFRYPFTSYWRGKQMRIVRSFLAMVVVCSSVSALAGEVDAASATAAAKKAVDFLIAQQNEDG